MIVCRYEKKWLLLSLLLILSFYITSTGWILAQSRDNDAVAENSDQEYISDIEVSGNLKVEKEAILGVISNKKDSFLNLSKIYEDIKAIYRLGYFYDVKVYKKLLSEKNKIVLCIQVKEKPAIMKISFSGMESIKSDDVVDKLSTKLYTLVNETVLQEDINLISKQYFEKGYYLVNVSYRIDVINDQEVEVVFVVDEGSIIKIGSISIFGNEHFSTSELVTKMMLKYASRLSNLPVTQPASFHDDILKRDVEFLAYFYRDNGFIDIQISKPIVVMDEDRKTVRITIEVDEGLQYKIGNVEFSGDLLFSEEELNQSAGLVKGDIFRISKFQKSVEILTEKYGDLGYAFVDVDVKRELNKDAPEPSVDLEYVITKGEKAYFGNFNVVGNVKTRDNVIRRELEVFESDLYSDSGIKQSENNIKRLGFFEEVKLLREIDTEENRLDYTIQVKEKPTGQIQASVAFQPSPSGKDSSWYAQGAYSDSNHFGRGWQTSLNLKWGGSHDYDLGFDFYNPKLNNGDWNFGVGADIERSRYDITSDTSVDKRTISSKVSLGRKIIEMVRGTVMYKISRIRIDDSFLISSIIRDGISSSVSFILSRNATNNYIEPSEGSNVSIKESVYGGIFGGDFDYYETLLRADYYYPIDFSETYRTYFRFGLTYGLLSSMKGRIIPVSERYKLGGPNDIRGYDYMSISPLFSVLKSPEGGYSSYPKGGDRKILFQTEYFFPLIKEAGLKGLLFYDMGRVYDDEEDFSLSGMYKDVGFGFRWNTPMAPFRFEFAYPIENGKLGDMKFVFYLGY